MRWWNPRLCQKKSKSSRVEVCVRCDLVEAIDGLLQGLSMMSQGDYSVGEADMEVEDPTFPANTNTQPPSL